MLCGWLSPEGKMITCLYMEHLDLAYELCEQHEFPIMSIPPDEVLVKHGWYKCYYSIFDYQVHLYGNDAGIITQEQKDVLRRDYEEHPEDWGKIGTIELKYLGVIDEEYDENGMLI